MENILIRLTPNDCLPVFCSRMNNGLEDVSIITQTSNNSRIARLSASKLERSVLKSQIMGDSSCLLAYVERRAFGF